MSRNIVEFGFAYYSTSFHLEGDKMIAAEPLAGLYENLEVPEDLDFFNLDEIAIADFDGTCTIHFDPNELEHAALVTFEELPQAREIPCLTLDSWLSHYADQGFTERIDVLNCVLNCDSGPVFRGFYFDPRPEFIMIRQPGFPDEAIDIMKSNDYQVYACGGAVIGIRRAEEVKAAGRDSYLDAPIIRREAAEEEPVASSDTRRVEVEPPAEVPDESGSGSGVEEKPRRFGGHKRGCGISNFRRA